MGIFSRTPPPSCPSARHCAQWAQTYLKYCLCSTKDGVALGLGLASVLSWGVAEVPQIITNYKQKSTEGLSLAFLMTWVVGDLFNLVGCFLEPATLPTQFYMALLYTITTLILTGQTIYYSHIYHLKVKKTGATGKVWELLALGLSFILAMRTLVSNSVYEQYLFQIHELMNYIALFA